MTKKNLSIFCDTNSSVFVRQYGTHCNFQTSDSWSILSDLEKRIKSKIEKIGTPLKDWEIDIYRGVLTGYNDAFIISRDKKDELIKSDPKSAEIIRPILRGRDIKKYINSFADLWLINTHNGIKEKGLNPIKINDYPAIKNHLERFSKELKNRADKGDTPYNLRNCAYMDDFSKQKIVWIELTDKANFCLDFDGYYLNNTVFFLTGNRLPYILSFLNSKLCEWYFGKIAATSGVGTRRWIKQYIEQICIPLSPPNDKEKELTKLVLEIQKLKKKGSKTKALENEIDDIIFSLFNLSTDEINFVGDFELVSA